MKFYVDVERVQRAVVTVVVEARDIESAKSIGLIQSQFSDWELLGSDYTVKNIEQVRGLVND